jgi:hypothetical protein
MRMPLERRAQFTQRNHIVERAESGECEPEIEAGRLVTGRPHDAVAIRPIGIGGIVAGSV